MELANCSHCHLPLFWYLQSRTSRKKISTIGQTGVEGIKPGFIKFIGLSEIAGAIGLIVPVMCNTAPWLTPFAALCLAFIMPFATAIHYKRRTTERTHQCNHLHHLLVDSFRQVVAGINKNAFTTSSGLFYIPQ